MSRKISNYQTTSDERVRNGGRDRFHSNKCPLPFQVTTFTTKKIIIYYKIIRKMRFNKVCLESFTRFIHLSSMKIKRMSISLVLPEIKKRKIKYWHYYVFINKYEIYSLQDVMNSGIKIWSLQIMLLIPFFSRISGKTTKSSILQQ